MAINAISSSLSLLNQFNNANRFSLSPSVGDIVSLSLQSYAQRKTNEFIPTSQASALGTLYDKLADVRRASSQLNSTGLLNNLFNSRTATSSNSSVLTGEISAGAAAVGGATIATYKLTVTALASSQINVGDDLDESTNSSVTAGTRTIRINIDGADNNISYTTAGSDTNSTVLDTIAAAINTADVGVTAEVVSNPGLGTIKLVLTGDETGTTHSFTVTDVSGNGASITGVDTVSSAATDSQYTVNGVDISSTSNTVYLDSTKVAVTLNAISATEVSLTVDENSEGLEEAIEDFTDTFNELRQFLTDYGSFFRDGFTDALDRFAANQKYALAEIGITIDSDGQLEIDSDTLSAALDSDIAKVTTAIGGYDGVATRVDLFSENLQSTPSHELFSRLNNQNSSNSALDLLSGSFLKGSLVNLFF